eukprot:scaffold1024_cov200-Pinguiococcus_pyrenoidosus.AAC.3
MDAGLRVRRCFRARRSSLSARLVLRRAHFGSSSFACAFPLHVENSLQVDLEDSVRKPPPSSFFETRKAAA